MTKYLAKFSNGVTKTRGTKSRTYTHAYQYITKLGYQCFGFSSSEAQCHANLKAETAWTKRTHGPLQFAEVVAIEEVGK